MNRNLYTEERFPNPPELDIEYELPPINCGVIAIIALITSTLLGILIGMVIYGTP